MAARIVTNPEHVTMWTMFGNGYEAIPLYRGKPNTDLPVGSEALGWRLWKRQRTLRLL